MTLSARTNFQLFKQHFTAIFKCNLYYKYVGKSKNLKCFVQLQIHFLYTIFRKAQEPKLGKETSGRGW